MLVMRVVTMLGTASDKISGPTGAVVIFRYCASFF